jgi:hypothetical protein
MTNSDILKKGMIEALEKTLGIVSSACKMVDISRQTHYRWLQEDEDYKKQCTEIENMTLDFAESQLHKQIAEGNTSATIFFLKTKGKKRGYVERMEVDNGEDNNSFRVEVIE